jgi:carbon storage regulator
MLVLSRKVGEAIMVSDTIRITVVEIRGNKVRLGIVAPAGVIVDRQEIHEKRKLLPMTDSSEVHKMAIAPLNGVKA